MRRIILVITLLSISFSCTKLKDDYKTEFIKPDALTINNLDTDLKVVNILVNQKEFDEMFTKYEEDIEIEGTFEMYQNKELIIKEEDVEIQIKGAHSASFSLKSLGVKFDDKYKNEKNNYNLINPKKLLPFHSLEKIKSIRFRNSGNDFIYTMLKDMSLTQLAIDAGLDVDLMYSDQTIVFINNKFYGILNLRTETNKHGLAGLYDADKDDVTIIKMVVGKMKLKDGEQAKMDALISAIQNKDFQFLKHNFEWNNLMDYMIFQSFLGNVDWPFTNVRLFAIKDNKFRFVLYDLDLALLDDLHHEPFDFIDHHNENLISDMFLLFLEDKEFKKQYDIRVKEIQNSSFLTPSYFNSVVDKNVNNIRDFMPIHIEKYKEPDTYSDWLFNVEKLKLNYKERYDIVD